MTHEGLYVMDGSMIPTSLGINPALTIAALSQRAICNPAHVALEVTAVLSRNWPGCQARLCHVRAFASRKQWTPKETELEFTEQLHADCACETSEACPFPKMQSRN
jgi:hypothetical protein